MWVRSKSKLSNADEKAGLRNKAQT